MEKNVLVALSGGVDSAVAAYLMLQNGYKVQSATMRVNDDEKAVEDAKQVAEHLGISHHVLDCRKVFSECVVKPFVAAYVSGRTPNPCILCNRDVKFAQLLEKAFSLGAEFLVTGHYAQICKLENGRYTLQQTLNKDQTYALSYLSQKQLAHTLMPLFSYNKEQVREIATKLNLFVAKKPDSQDICFVSDGDCAGFVASQHAMAEGDFVLETGEIVGKHKGIGRYTIGQRKGLGSFGKPLFVKEIVSETNQVVLSEEASLYQNALVAECVNFMAVSPWEGKMRANVKVRYAHQSAPANIWLEDDKLLCHFDEPQRAITNGQAVVCYIDNMILCAATIVSSFCVV